MSSSLIAIGISAFVIFHFFGGYGYSHQTEETNIERLGYVIVDNYSTSSNELLKNGTNKLTTQKVVSYKETDGWYQCDITGNVYLIKHVGCYMGDTDGHIYTCGLYQTPAGCVELIKNAEVSDE